MKKIIIILCLLCIGFVFDVAEAQAIAKVKNLEVLKRRPKQIELQWDKVKVAKFYQLRVLKKKNNKYKVKRKIKVTKRRKNIKNLKYSTKYYFRARACKKKKNCGAWSKRVKGKTKTAELQERIDFLYEDLHELGSGARARDAFTDLELIYTDNEGVDFYPEEIRPFRYYYSDEAELTIAICNIEQTVIICTTKLDRLLTEDDLDDCSVADEILERDTRL